MMKRLSNDEIKQISLEILIYFHKFCEENNLTYYLAYGTLLGAVRHKGFIPWDDDIDVYMPRNDYEKFLREFDKKNTNKIFKTISMYNNKDYYLNFARLVNTNTLIVDKIIDNLWIDIFPLDNMSNDKKNAKILHKKIKFWRYLLVHKLLKFYITSKKQKNFNIIIFLKNFFHYIIKLLVVFIPIKYISLKIDALSKTYKEEKNSKYIGRYVDSSSKFEIYDSNLFNGKILLDFEGYKFWATKEYDKILTQYFGNYMKLPPKNKRVNHSIEAYLKEE